MKNGFIKVAAVSPQMRLADPIYNTDELIRLTKDADKAGVSLAVFPELCLTGATCGELFFSDFLVKAALRELARFLEGTKKLSTVAVVGLPFLYRNKLYNCAAVCAKGEVLGIVPKTYLSREEARFFASGADFTEAAQVMIPFLKKDCAIAPHQVFGADSCQNLTFSIEIGEEFAAAFAPSISHAEAGARIICNPATTQETVTASDFSKQMMLARSASLNTAYISASPRSSESTTDAVFGGYRMICENGALLAEAAPFSESEMLITEVDVDLLARERCLNPTRLSAIDTSEYLYQAVSVKYRDTELSRHIPQNPFLPDDVALRAARCEKILNIQAYGLKERMERAYVKKAVIGISGGLDSTLALLVAVRAIDLLKRPRTDVLAVTMPGFGTTGRTKSNATILCEQLGVEFRCVSIAEAVNQHFSDIGHDPAVRDITYENCQARERTQILMDIANGCGGMVIGTGDLSELALGWATYNGDHMSMYGVNASVPKTLMRHVVSHCADLYEKDGEKTIAAALRDILDTPISPELLPAEENGEIAQKTEDLVGPYELHDFYIYYFLRYGFAPDKLLRIAKHALGDVYSDQELVKWLETFLRRFFAQQFKRSCLPDGPAVGSVNLSPRGGWMMPSDASSAAWMKEMAALREQFLK